VIDSRLNKPKVFAQQILEYMRCECIGDNCLCEVLLARIIVTRSEVDLDEIQRAFKAMNGGKSLDLFLNALMAHNFDPSVCSHWTKCEHERCKQVDEKKVINYNKYILIFSL
jgi:hypothetical protein